MRPPAERRPASRAVRAHQRIVAEPESVSRASSSSIELAPDAAFSCHQCNRCCRGSWIIGISPEEAERLRALYPSVEPVDGDAGERGGVRYSRLARRPDGSCVFLEPGGCRIHTEHGEYAKPAVCRKFPFAVFDVGGSRHLHLSRVCPSVYAHKGDRGDALAAAAARVAGPGPVASTAPAHVALAGTASVSWTEYQELERRIESLIRDERWPLDDAMAAVGILIRRWADGARAGECSVPGSRRAEGPGERGEAMELVLEAIARRDPMVGLHRYVLATVVTVIESRREGRAWSSEATADMARYLRILLARGRERLAGRVREEGPIEPELKRIGATPWPRRHDPSLEPVRSLLASHIRRKFLVTSGPDIEFAWHLLLVAYAVLKFYARAAAVAAGRDRLIPSDIEEAVRVVEFHLLLHPQHLPPLQDRFLGGWFRKFLFHPAFPSSMTAL